MAEKKGFFKQFKEFITRGNVLDMAVGIIVGGAFTAIITALVNGLLTPLLQSIGVGADGFGALQVVLREAVVDEAGAVLSEAVVLDFGIVISAIITFLLTAFILFLIVYTVNTMHAKRDARLAKYAPLTEDEIKSYRYKGNSWEKIAAAAAEKQAKLDAEAAEAAKNAPAPAPTAEELLTQIRDLLQAQSAQK